MNPTLSAIWTRLRRVTFRPLWGTPSHDEARQARIDVAREVRAWGRRVRAAGLRKLRATPLSSPGPHPVKVLAEARIAIRNARRKARRAGAVPA